MSRVRKMFFAGCTIVAASCSTQQPAERHGSAMPSAAPTPAAAGPTPNSNAQPGSSANASPSATPNPNIGTGGLRSLPGASRVMVGAAVDAAKIMNPSTDPQYSKVLAQNYNLVVAENATKMDAIYKGPGQYDFSQGDAIADFAKANGMKMRLHTLAWTNQVPAWVQAISDGNQLSQVLHDYIFAVVGHYLTKYPGMIVAIDVVNEYVGNGGGVWNKIGNQGDFVGLAFQWAKQAAQQADPSHKVSLFYNDFANNDSVFTYVSGLKSAGIPIDGVGIQSHAMMFSDSSLASQVTRLANAGFEVQLTEVDVRLLSSDGMSAPSAELSMQANVYQNLIHACTATPKCTAFVTWGFTDKYSWIPSFYPGFGAALPFDASYQPKPAYNSIASGLAQ